jgi:hypothetical protein
MKISFHVKTNLRYDGRVLASVDAINKAYPNSDIRISLLPDGAGGAVDLPANVTLDEIVVPMRNWKMRSLFRGGTILWYCIVDLVRTLKFRPNVVHIHDKTAAFAPFLYRIIRRNRCFLIYDDHEIFNRPRSFSDKIYWCFERMIARMADEVIVANKQRGRIVKRVYGLSRPPVVIENFFYDRSQNRAVDYSSFQPTERILRDQKNSGIKLLLHQGSLLDGRGLELLKQFPSRLPPDWKLCIIGPSPENYQNSGLNASDRVLFLGKIQFEFLPKLYGYMDGAIILYLPGKLNNRYCAPNRLYQAISNGLPLVVNRSNPVLFEVVSKNGNGVGIASNNIDGDLDHYFTSFSTLSSRASEILEDFHFDISARQYVSIYARVDS